MKINSLARRAGSSRKLVSLKKLSRQAGIGLVEIMVAMAIGVFMLGGILSLVLWVSQARVELDKTSEQIENGRYAIQLISDELRLAGFFGTSQVGADAYSLPSACPSTIAELGFNYDTATTTMTLPVAVQGFANLAAADATCFSGLAAGSEALLVRRVETSSVTAAASGVPYIQMSECQDDTLPMIFGVAGSPGFDLKARDCSSTAVLWPYTFRAFYLSDCDICGPSDGIPTLKMTELRQTATGVELAAQSMVEGIEDIHFEYGVDLNADGAPDCYVPDPSADTPPSAASCPAAGWSATDATNWSNVVSVRINLLARSTEPSAGWSDDRKYDLGRKDASGNSALEGPFNDNYRRQVYSTVVTLPNVSGVRE